MSETKFTPGPWCVENGVPGKPRIFSSAKNLLKSIVCECIGARSRRKHDAALIAAAPEMYEKLAWMQKQFDASDSEELVALGWEIEELLKKARGEK